MRGVCGLDVHKDKKTFLFGQGFAVKTSLTIKKNAPQNP